MTASSVFLRPCVGVACVVFPRSSARRSRLVLAAVPSPSRFLGPSHHYTTPPPSTCARKQAHLSPMPNPKSSPIPPEVVHGGDGYGTPHGAGMPTPHMTPGTQAAVAMSNMSLSPMPHPNDNNTWAPSQPQQVCLYFFACVVAACCLARQGRAHVD